MLFSFIVSVNFTIMGIVWYVFDRWQPSLNGKWFDTHGFEKNGRIYDYVCVNLFRQTLQLIRWNRLLGAPRVTKDIDLLRQMEWGTRFGEATHWACLALLLPIAGWSTVATNAADLGYWLLSALVFHGYPIMLQRYNRPRFRQLLRKFDLRNTMLAMVITLPASIAYGQDLLAEAFQQFPAAIDIATGHEIPSEGYCDQPYVVKLPDGTWLCTMTTGKGHEGQTGQHIVSCRSADQGANWSSLVDIEPADGPEASWAMPYLTSYGRVYVFYTYNADNLREVTATTPYARTRVDTLGKYAFKFSDDGGRTWSRQRWFIPVRETNIDRCNPYQGTVRFFWGVGKPIRHKDSMFLGFTKVERFGENFIAASESWFLRCANIDVERDPDDLIWETLPEGDDGLRSPEGPIASEANLTSLSDGSLFCTYRTVAGHPCHAYSRDDGKSWTKSAFMTYGPSRRLVDHPRAANFVRKLTQGPYEGRFLYWFHNNQTKGWDGRNPGYLLGGTEVDTPDGKQIRWSEPVAVLYDRDPKTRISYPDFIWDDGLYLTETQKATARVHRIPDELLQYLWSKESRDQQQRLLPR